MNKHAIGKRSRRREVIRALVRGGGVRSQAALSRLLRAQGFAVAQPTLSRDVAALGLVKSAAGYAAPGEGPAPGTGLAGAAELDRVLGELVLSVRAAGPLVVVRTPPAGASPVARAVDEARLPGVAGSVAGDDTVFLATPGPAAARRIAQRLRGPLGPLRRGA